MSTPRKRRTAPTTSVASEGKEQMTAPHSIEAEQSVIGSLLLDNSAFRATGGVIQAEHFYRREHRTIFEAIANLLSASRPADVVTVFEELKARGEAEAVGGLAYLNALAQSVASAGNIRRYAEIVRDRADARAFAAGKAAPQADVAGPAAFATAEVLPIPMQLLVDPGSSNATEIARLFSELSSLYRACGGSGLTFELSGSRELERVVQ